MIVLIKDLIGTKPVSIDQRTRNADGSLKYPDVQKEPRPTVLLRVWTERKDGQLWLMWEWDRIRETPYCNYSGISVGSKHESNYALEVTS